MTASLIEHLRRRIQRDGPVTLADYMAEALFNPRFGYYVLADRLGAGGDFITAPEISQMFGELIGLWLADTWAQMGSPDPVLLAELGPGRGTLMADALRAARMLPGFRAAVRLHLVEASPVFRRRQATTLADAQPIWHDTVGTLPEGPLLFVANEFFDALPIRQLQKMPAGWAERRIGIEPTNHRLCFVLDRPSAVADFLVPAVLRDAPMGSVLELCPAAQAVMFDLADRIARHGGAGLVIDYGYVGPRCGETLQAVKAHAPVGVLDDPGEADLTAHVDFAALSAACRKAGAVAFGPVSQGTFLTRLGIHDRAERLCTMAAPGVELEIKSALDRLIAAGGMGTLFQVMALTHPDHEPPAGFSTAG